MKKIVYQIKDTQGARVRFSFFYRGAVYSRTIYLSIADEDIVNLTDNDLYRRLKTAVEKYLALLATATRSAATTLLMCAEVTPWESVNCRNCKNCKNCVNCVGCNNLHSCVDCINCDDCINCENCKNCKNCVNCKTCSHTHHCVDCDNCVNCEKCTKCLFCSLVDNSRYCKHCTSVKNCYRCSSCKNLIECSNLVHRSNTTFESCDERFIRFDDEDDDELPF